MDLIQVLWWRWRNITNVSLYSQRPSCSELCFYWFLVTLIYILLNNVCLAAHPFYLQDCLSSIKAPPLHQSAFVGPLPALLFSSCNSILYKVRCILSFILTSKPANLNFDPSTCVTSSSMCFISSVPMANLRPWRHIKIKLLTESLKKWWWRWWCLYIYWSGSSDSSHHVDAQVSSLEADGNLEAHRD